MCGNRLAIRKKRMRRVETLKELSRLLREERGALFETGFHDPFSLPGVSSALEILHRAHKKNQRVLVYGDYDADGITATAILVLALRCAGVSTTPYLPHRLDDGYALHQTVLEALINEFDVLIAADCGVSNGDEISWLKSQGKTVIVVDHHEFSETLPSADAILHPRIGSYPFGHLSGAGVAWKLAHALLGQDQANKLVDLAMLGTVADVVPLLGENRALVKLGLKKIMRTERVGLAALTQACRLQGACSAEDVAYRLAPRLNAAGRMDHPQPALDLLLAESTVRADELVQQLNLYNTQRQAASKSVMKAAQADVDLSLPFVFSANTAWSAGIVGLAAGHLARQYARPAIVVGGNGTLAVGSARAPRGCNVLELLVQGREHLVKLGGHARAAGFSLEEKNIPRLQQALSLAHVIHVPASEPAIEALLPRELLTWDLLDIVEELEPYGEGNPKPRFMAQGLSVLDARLVGKKREHLKLMLKGGYEPLEAIGFGLGKSLPKGSRPVDIVFTVEANEYGGRRRLQLSLEKIR